MTSLRENIKKSLDDNLKKRDDIATATLRLILAAIKDSDKYILFISKLYSRKRFLNPCNPMKKIKLFEKCILKFNTSI